MPITYTRPITHTNNINGYVYFMDKNHPLATKVGMVYMHRHVLSLKVGRWLRRAEHAHHINGNKKDNSPDNLEIVSESVHTSRHGIERATRKCLILRVVRCCDKCGSKYRMTHGSSRFCSLSCYRKSCKTSTLDVEVIHKEVMEAPLMHVAKKYNMSGSGMKKFCSRNYIATPKRGHWQRLASPNYGKPVKPKGPYSRGLTHGTNSGYTTHACRCTLCREAHTKHARESRKRADSQVGKARSF